MSKIGIIVEPYEEKNASGLALCILEQTIGLLNIDKENEYLIYTSTPFRKERLTRNAKNIIIPKSFFGKNLWFIKNAFFNKKLIPDVLIFNMPLLPMILPKKIKTVPIFYELIYETAKHSIKSRLLNIIRRFLVWLAIKKSSLIVTPSFATYNDLIGVYKIDKSKIKNIYIGFQDFSQFKDREVEINPSYKPYFMFVGKVKFKKNVHGMIDGFIKFKKKTNAPHKFVILGSYGGKYYDEIIENLRKHNLEKEVVFHGYIYNEELYSFYKNATSLMFTTFKEGFGMPTIEAMSLGVPVITSNCTSSKEIAEGAALLVDPKKPEEIAEAMEKISSNQGLVNDLISKGLERSKKFSWNKHVIDLLASIRNLM